MARIKVGIPILKELVHKRNGDRRDSSYSRHESKIVGWSYKKEKIDSLVDGFICLLSSESTR